MIGESMNKENTEAYLELCKTSMMKFFGKMVNEFSWMLGYLKLRFQPCSYFLGVGDNKACAQLLSEKNQIF